MAGAEPRHVDPPMRLLLVVVFSGLFLALAVAARGGIGAFFAQPALIGLTVALVALCAAALVAGGNLSPGVREDTSNRWVIAVFGVITLDVKGNHSGTESSSPLRWREPNSNHRSRSLN